MQTELRSHYVPTVSTITKIHTGLNRFRKGIVTHNHETIIIGFQGSADDEIHMNLWTDGKGPNWWHLPYPVYVKGNRVHSFYLDMWNGMKIAVFSALSDAVTAMRDHDIVPKRLIITGHSMSRGVSTLAFTDIVEHIRHVYGSQCSSPQDWTLDHTLGSLIQHLTFASTGAGDKGYLTLLNELYERYQIRAWNFCNDWDHTRHLPPYHFRYWRGHRYFLPHHVTLRLGAEFGSMGHWIQGYYQSVECTAQRRFDELKAACPSGYA